MCRVSRSGCCKWYCSLLHRPRAFRNETIVTFMTGIGSDVVIQGRNDGSPVSTSLTLFRVPNVTSQQHRESRVYYISRYYVE